MEIGGYYYALGKNPFTSGLPLDKNKIAISPNGDGYFDSVDAVRTSLLRNARTLKYSVTDKDENVIYDKVSEYERKSYFISSIGIINYALHEDSWTGLDAGGIVLPEDSTYTYKIAGTLDYSEHPMSNEKDFWEFPQQQH